MRGGELVFDHLRKPTGTKPNDLTPSPSRLSRYGSGHHHGGFPITHLFHALANARSLSLEHASHTSQAFLHIHPTIFGAKPSASSLLLTDPFFPHPDHQSSMCRSARIVTSSPRQLAPCQ